MNHGGKRAGGGRKINPDHPTMVGYHIRVPIILKAILDGMTAANVRKLLEAAKCKHE